MANGSIFVSGLQTGVPSGGNQAIGPFSIPCSATQDTNAWTVNTATTVPVPALANGVLMVPPVGGTVAWSYKTTSGDTGIHGDQALPVGPIPFDAANQPSNLYLTSASSVVITVQFF